MIDTSKTDTITLEADVNNMFENIILLLLVNVSTAFNGDHVESTIFQ